MRDSLRLPPRTQTKELGRKLNDVGPLILGHSARYIEDLTVRTGR